MISNVAIRPPELNLLAPVILRDFAEQMGKHESATDPHVLLTLGDVTNIACSGEFDLFAGTLKKLHGSNGPVVIMAHGNHDTYLMGTVNSYYPVYDRCWRPPALMAKSDLPTDEHWWGSPDHPDPKSFRNWKDTCYDCGITDGTPMNKSRWLRRYIDLLEKQGLERLPNPTMVNGGYPLDFRGRPGTPLGDLNYQTKGWWFPPAPVDVDDLPDWATINTGFAQVYRSFLVQQLDLPGGHRLFVIDTSVIQRAGGYMQKFITTNAGTHAAIGKDQFTLLEAMLTATQDDPRVKHVTVAAHFPIKDLTYAERNSLLKAMSRFPKWNFLSGHTHYDKGAYQAFQWEGGTEINVASTTDWPMASNRVAFDQGGGLSIRPYRIPLPGDLTYKYARGTGAPEICRHLPAARKIEEAARNPDPKALKWESLPPCTGCALKSKEDWEAKGKELNELRGKIDALYQQGGVHRAFLLRLAAAASKAESERTIFRRVIP